MALGSARSGFSSALRRLTDAAVDSRRSERVAVVLLIGYCAVWTLYGALAKGSQDIHFDMGEMIAWSREVVLGTPKHPPLAAWLVRAWFSVFPLADWSYYLFAMAMATASLWIAWAISARYLAAEKRIVALALLTFIPFFNFHALKFNANTVMLPLWALTAWMFLRSYETRGLGFAALAGIAAAAAMLGKYWSIFLLAGLALAALIDARRAAYFRSPAPWVTIAFGAVALAPHVVWLYVNDFTPFDYALASHAGTAASALRSAFGYIAGAAGYAVLPVLVALAAAWPSPTRAAIADVVWPVEPTRRLILFAFLLPIVLPAGAAIVTHSEIVSIWTMGSFTLLPIVLLSSARITVSRTAAMRVLAGAIAVPLVATLAAPVIAVVIHRLGVPNHAARYRLVAQAVERAWAETTDRPLRIIGSYNNLLYGTLFYFTERPTTYEIVTPSVTPWVDEARIAHDGIAMVCPIEEHGCIDVADRRAAKNPAAKRSEVEIARSHLGIAGEPQRYVIVTVPPRH